MSDALFRQQFVCSPVRSPLIGPPSVSVARLATKTAAAIAMTALDTAARKSEIVRQVTSGGIARSESDVTMVEETASLVVMTIGSVFRPPPLR